MTDPIKKLDDNEQYIATIRLSSKGNDDGVAMTFEVSHVLDDEFEDNIPACYGVAREIMMGLRRQSVMYAPTEADTEYLTDPNVSDEDKMRYVLECAQAQEEASNSTIN